MLTHGFTAVDATSPESIIADQRDAQQQSLLESAIGRAQSALARLGVSASECDDATLIAIQISGCKIELSEIKARRKARRARVAR